MQKILAIVGILISLLCACTVGPDYVRPPVQVPTHYKEAPRGWKIAKPQDNDERGEWWKVFRDPQLNALEAKLNISNQNIALAAANYRQAQALIDEARASYFPTLAGSALVTRQTQGGDSSFIGPDAADPSSSSSSSSAPQTAHALTLNASWEPDLWGSVRRAVEASRAGAQASAAQLGLARLSAQASLAQFYFELRGLDTDQKLLDDTVKDYQKTLTLTLHRYAAGVAGRTDVVQAQSQLQSAQASAINNGISRGQLEHAIAVLIGQPPATFKIVFHPLHDNPPVIPLQAPSVLLERRPDVAQAERLMAQANAQIGVAISAYFPALTLTGAVSAPNTGLAHWFSVPALSWALGSELAETILDGGLRIATTAAARAAYESTAASYRQTVLAAFQDVEDNLIALRLLTDESIVQDKAADSARLALKLIMNQYKAGTLAFSDVVLQQILTYNAEKIAADVHTLRMTAAVGLIKSLGGGWNTRVLNKN